MAQLARDEAGNVWEVDAQGNATRLAQPAGGRTGMVVRDPFTVPKENAQLDNTQQSTKRSSSLLPSDLEKNQNEAITSAYKRDNAKFERENQAGTQAFDRAKALRNDYLNLPSVKNYTQALPVYASGLQSTANPAGDQNLIYAYAKIMDPNSVVREGEQASVANADSVYNATVSKLKNQLERTGQFAPQYRLELRQQMATRMGELNRQFIADRVNFKENAQRNGVNPLDVVGEHPGSRYQAISEKVLGLQHPELDFYGNKIGPTNDIGGGDGGNGPVASGGTKTVPVPEANAIIDRMVRNGASVDQAQAALKAMGFNSQVNPAQYAAAVAHFRKNPGYKGSYGQATMEVPTSLWNQISASPAASAVAGIGNGLTAGGMDEVGGLVKSAFTGQPLDQAIADADKGKRALSAQSPLVYGLGNLVGSGVSMIGATKLAGALPVAAQLGRFAPYVGGGLYGAINGGLENNQNRVGGAALGSVLGVAGQGVADYIASPLVGAALRTKPATAAINRVYGMMGRNPVPPALSPSPADAALLSAAQKADLGIVKNRLTDAEQLGVPMTIADASPELRELAGSAVRNSPSASSVAENALLPRGRGQIDRLGAAVTRDLGPIGNTTELSAAIRDKARTDAAPLYEAAYGVPGRSSPELESLLNTPFGREGLGKARTIAANERVDPNKMGFDLNDQGETILTSVPSMRTIDLAKRGMDDVLEQYRNPLTGRLELSDAGRAQNNVKNQFLTEADRLVPEYGAARAAYQGPMESLDALNLGRDLYAPGISPNELSASIAGRPPEHLLQAQLGYRDAMMNQANKSRFSTNPFEATLGTPQAEAKLSALYPDNPGVSRLLQQRDLERDLAQNTTAILGNSKTAQRQLADQEFRADMGPVLEGGLHVGAAVATHGASVPGTAARLLGSSLKDKLTLGLSRRATAKADDLAAQMFNTDPAANKIALDKLFSDADAWRAYVDATTPRRSLRGMFGAGSAVLTNKLTR